MDKNEKYLGSPFSQIEFSALFCSPTLTPRVKFNFPHPNIIRISSETKTFL